MFGYVMVNRAGLSEADQKRFSAYYCGLCRALREDYGLAGRFTLTYDMTFLAVLLTSLYEPETASGEARCIVHPRKKRAYFSNEAIEYAAAMNFALAYHKLIDDWKDDKNLLALSGSQLMQRRYARIEKRYPRQCQAMRQCLDELAGLEAENCRVADLPAACFGRLLGEIFVMREDFWADSLRRMGAALGRYVYLLDACDDLEKDARRGRYNPLSDIQGAAEHDGRFRAILTVPIAQCTQEFEALPLVEDIEILRNILYSGVWTRYESIRRGRDGGKGARQ